MSTSNATDQLGQSAYYDYADRASRYAARCINVLRQDPAFAINTLRKKLRDKHWEIEGALRPQRVTEEVE